MASSWCGTWTCEAAMRIIQSENPRPLNLLAVGPNGLVAAASSAFGADSGVEVWDIASGTGEVVLSQEGVHPGSIAFTHDGRLLGFKQQAGSVFLPHLLVAVKMPDQTIDAVAGDPPAFELFALSLDASHLLLPTQDSGAEQIECRRITGETTFRRLWRNGPRRDCHFRYYAMAVSNSGRGALASEETESERREHDSQWISIRDESTGQERAKIFYHAAEHPQQLAFTVDGSKLLVRTESRTVQLFDAATGAPAGELVHAGRPYVTGMAVHPRGPVACARTNGTVTFWDAEKREQLRTLDWKAGRLVS